MKWIALSLLSVSAFAQTSTVEFSFSFEPPEVLSQLHISTLSIVDIAACNNGGMDVLVAPERVRMASPVGLITYDRALAMLTVKQAQTIKSVLAQVAQYALIGAGVIGGGGFFSISAHGLGELAAGSGVASMLRDRWQSEIPSLAPFIADALKDPIPLAAGACATRSAFGPKMCKAALRASAKTKATAEIRTGR
jgi:hypothetical protein